MIKVVCDNCGAVLDPAKYMASLTIMELVHVAVPLSGQPVNAQPTQRRTEKHYCSKCMDKVDAAIKPK